MVVNIDSVRSPVVDADDRVGPQTRHALIHLHRLTQCSQAASSSIYMAYTSVALWLFWSIRCRCSIQQHVQESCDIQRWPRDARYISGSNKPLRRYDHSKLSKMAAWRQIGFDVTGNSAIQSVDPENATLESNMKFIGSPVAEIWPFAYLGTWGI